jgi:hypothetical protein
MPTEIRRSILQIIAHSKTCSASPFTIAAVIAFVILHLISGVMLERSHASTPVAASAFAALDDEAKCPAEVKQQEPSLPYD